MPRPDDWDTMDSTQRAQWSQQWANSPEAAAYWARTREHFEQAPTYEVTIQPDGAFTIEGVPPSRYNFHLVIPAQGAQGDDR